MTICNNSVVQELFQRENREEGILKHCPKMQPCQHSRYFVRSIETEPVHDTFEITMGDYLLTHESFAHALVQIARPCDNYICISGGLFILMDLFKY